MDGCASTSLNDDRTGIGNRIGFVAAGRAVRRGACPPAVGRAPERGRLQRIADGQRKAVAVGLLVPIVAVGEILHDAAVRGIQLDFLARIVQVAAVLAGDQRRADAGIADVERRLIGDDQHVLVRRQGDVGEGEGDAVVEPQSRQRQRARADVLDLDVLEIFRARCRCSRGRSRRPSPAAGWYIISVMRIDGARFT